MVFLASHGYRCIAHDRRGHGRSSQPWHGNDMNTYADGLATLVDAQGLPTTHTDQVNADLLAFLKA
jgi:non-heme chloroperoxidase